ncbi:hypothetical protein ACQV2T_08375 [Facklamia sp. P13069]|uniref:hypothetical protein n=1 Tax=Facklamia sp. P13069 TaxID=3421954 RepID=UPI003D17C640
MNYKPYERTVEILDKLRNKALDVARFSDPSDNYYDQSFHRSHIGILKDRALKEAPNNADKIHLKAILDLNDHQNYYSEEFNRLSQELEQMIEEEDINTICKMEQAELLPEIIRMKQKLADEIDSAREEINKVIKETEVKANGVLEKLRAIERVENYIFNSTHRYDMNTKIVSETLTSHKLLTPIAVTYHDVDKNERNSMMTLFDKNVRSKYVNYDLRKDILGGL